MSEPRSDAPSQRPPSRPQDRYGAAESTSGVAGKVVAGLLVLLVGALLVAGAVTIYRLNATPDITGEVIGVEVVDEELPDPMTVSRDEPGIAVYCIVRAQDQSRELGRREVYVRRRARRRQVDTEIATTSRAYMKDVYGCGDDVPDYLRS